ncbi:hypothetical protein PN498_27950 [Oscillatoria sp. CS-180]|uniref:hypothetical protein n=1 Tax=Oscillatoria sp. CS-180 TaxID=3021720 RepID=UPI00232D6891|nr:hypothetical protein [Oscillatoria sp. CS-180]MDB9529853.1 hypothetical protein [Oscillatoria sp. CS-180]
MSALSRPKKRRPLTRTTSLWFERMVAIIALLNLILVLFDVSYIRFRDFYLRFFPELTTQYGELFKGIEPERTTENYLETIDTLREQVAQTGLSSVQAESLLEEVREQSTAIIDENPFQIADKSGTLERIKNLMRDRIGVDSSKAAFNTFWSEDYLTQAGWSQEIEFFSGEVIPLLETNYFRGISEDGSPQDDFWRLDIWFVLFMALELLARTFYISRRYKNYTWLDAVLLRWYDLIFFLPFWRWLRIIPVTIRLNQSQLVNLVPLRNRVNRIFIANFAVELTEIVVLRIIDQIQRLIQDGSVSEWLLQTTTSQRYIDINGVNEIEAITNSLTTLVVYKVLPNVKPELDALLQHNIVKAFEQAPGYQGFRGIPGIGDLPEQIAQQIVSQTSENLYSVLTGSLEDEKAAELTQQLIEKMGEQLRVEIQQNQTVDNLENWTVALLEEIKINYVKRLSIADADRLREENYKLYDITQVRQR